MQARDELLHAPQHRVVAMQHLFQPLGIASLSSQLKALGIPVTQYDCTFRSFEEVTGRIVAQGEKAAMLKERKLKELLGL